jgi:uncharacterized protein YecA (UPF0149 family)
MGTESVGRNDPCPCGSGKKYKHCCLRKDRQQGIRSRTEPAQVQPQRELASALTRLRGLQRRATRRGRADKTPELDQFVELAEEVAAFEAMSDEIYAAIDTLEEHRSEFEAMMRSDEVVDHTRRFFSEERFARWWFTAEDVYRAFEAVGYPEGRIEAQGNVELAEAALLHLVGQEQRARLAWQLLMLLPEYVNAGRYLDAWLVQYSAFQMLETPERSNPFLSMMFYHGYQEWATEIEDQRRKVVRAIGFDPDEIRTSDPSLEEIEARVQAVWDDPEKRARVEAAQERYAMLAAQTEAEVWEWQQNAMRLLDREDAARLYLSDEEMEPWIPMLEERLGPLSVEVEQALAEGRAEDPGITDAVSQEMFAISKEMAAKIFTPQRLAQLREELQAYRHDLDAAQDRQAAVSVHGALISLKGDLDPGEEPLLIVICVASIRALLIGFAEGMGTETE